MVLYFQANPSWEFLIFMASWNLVIYHWTRISPPMISSQVKKTSFGPLNGVWATEWYAYFSTIKHNITSFTKRLTPSCIINSLTAAPPHDSKKRLLRSMQKDRNACMHVCTNIYIYIHVYIYITCMYVCIWFIYVECWNSQSSIFSI